MPKLSFTKRHSVGLDEAKARTKSLVEKFTQQHGKIVNKVSWSSDGSAADAKGKGFKGTFRVDGSQVRVDVDLSFVAIPFKGRVEEGIQRELDEAFPEG